MKHLIQEDDILSVPDFEIKTLFTKDESILIKKLCMNLLNISRVKNNSNEVGLLIDCFDYHNLKWYIGSENNVKLRYNWDSLIKDDCYNYSNRFIFIHNHPSNSGISKKDITSFLSNKYLCCLVVVQNNGTLHFLYKLKETNQSTGEWFDRTFSSVSEFYRVCSISDIYYVRKIRRNSQ